MQPEQDPTTRLLHLLRFKARGMTITEISRATKMNRNSVAKYLQMLLVSGQVAVENVGNAKVYSLSRRIPLSAILSYSSDLIAVIDHRGTIVQANDPFIRFLDRNREHVLGASFDDGTIPIFLNPDLRASIERGMEGEENTLDISYEDAERQVAFHVKCIPTTLEGGEGGLTIFFEDISERKQIEHVLVESEERFRRLVEQSPFPISIIDAAGRYLFLNKKFVEIFGYTHEDILSGEDWFSRAFPDPDIRHAAVHAWKEDLLTSGVGVPRPRMFPVTCRDGNVREILFRPITMSDGNQFIFYEDITESLHLEKMQSLLAAIVESSEDAIIGIDLDGTIVSWNKGAESLYGYSIDETIGQPRSLLIPASQRSEIGMVLDCVQRGACIDRFETRRRRRDGSTIDVSVTVSPIIDEHGVVLGASTISRDITEKKRADRELRASHQKLLDIIEFLPDAIFVTDTDNTVIAWNSAIEQLSGVKKEEMLGKGNREYSIPFYGKTRPCLLDLLFTPEEDLVQHYPLVQREGDSLQCEVFSQHLFEGRGAHLWIKARPLYDAEGSVAGAVESIQDITERKRIEEDLKESEFRFRRMAEYAPFPILIVDPEGTIRYANDRFTELFGYTVDMLGSLEGWLAAAFPDEKYRTWAGRIWREELRASLGYLNTGPVFSILTRTGEQRSVIIHPVTLDEGSSYVTFEDVTEQKRIRNRELGYTRNLELLSRFSTDLAHLRSSRELYEYVCDQIGTLVPETLVVGFSCEEHNTHLRIQAMRGLRETLNAIESAVGRSIQGLEVLLAEDAMQYLRLGRMHRIRNMDESFLGVVLPGATASKVAAVLGKSECYVMGFVGEKDLLGGIMICPPEGKTLQNEGLITTFANQASVALFRCHAEEHLLRAHLELEEQLLEHSRALSNANEILNLESIERKYIARSLRRQSALLFSLLDLLDIVIVGTDQRGRITMINKRASELFQYTSADVAGMPWYDLLASAGFRAEAQALHKEVFEGGSRGDILMRTFVTRQGEEKILVVNLRGTYDEHGVPAAVYLFGEEPPGRNVLKLSKYLDGGLILPPSE
jgi:PAS domain S-box-containing protein